MQKWEYYFVFAMVTNDGEFRPRFANDEELDDWQTGPTLYVYANQLREGGWELLASNPPMSIALYVFLCYCFRCSENLPANYSTAEERFRIHRF